MDTPRTSARYSDSSTSFACSGRTIPMTSFMDPLLFDPGRPARETIPCTETGDAWRRGRWDGGRMTATRPQGMALTDEQLEALFGRVGGADSIALKVTIPDSERRSTVEALGMAALEGQIRQVWFFDTPDLALNSAGLVV